MCLDMFAVFGYIWIHLDIFAMAAYIWIPVAIIGYICKGWVPLDICGYTWVYIYGCIFGNIQLETGIYRYIYI